MVAICGYVYYCLEMKRNNPVAKHSKINRAATHTDKKKAAKGGYTKHKGKGDGQSGRRNNQDN